MDISIPESFEKPTQEEWDAYLGIELFDNLRIDEELFSDKLGLPVNAKYFNLTELIKAYNNRVGSLNITYVLGKHYYDKGVPEQHKGKDGWYYTNFNKEQMIRRYWFCYYADSFYVQIFSLWDTLINLINQHYDLNVRPGKRYAENVIEKIKSINPELRKVLLGLFNDSSQQTAYKYRIMASHGLSLGKVSGKLVVTIKDVIISPIGKELMEGEECEGKMRAKKYGYRIKEEYIEPKEIMGNIEDYTKTLGHGIQQIVQMIVKPIQSEEVQIEKKTT